VFRKTFPCIQAEMIIRTKQRFTGLRTVGPTIIARPRECNYFPKNISFLRVPFYLFTVSYMRVRSPLGIWDGREGVLVSDARVCCRAVGQQHGCGTGLGLALDTAD